MKTLCKDLADEYQALDDVVAGLSPEQWEIVTPFDKWTIKDEISHLAYFDRAAFLSATDQQAFNKDLEQMLKDFTNYDDMHCKINAVGGQMSPADLLSWWRKEREQLVAAFSALDPKTRLPWYGPTMSARSSATARIMETWAHGQDVVDALKMKRKPSPRLKHIAHIGVTTFGWSYKNRQLAVPETQVRVELAGPDNEMWNWGPEDANDRIAGHAQDFCLVVTQRRHVDDTSLIVNGEVAKEWMCIAQAFAGPAEEGPQPGERVVNS